MEQILPFLLWGGLFFLMMRFGCGSHLFGRNHGQKGHDGGHQDHGHGCCGPTASRKSEKPKADQPAVALRDPVCGARVSVENSKTSVHAGTVFHFCSRECREVFEAAPDSYLPEAEGPPASLNSRLLRYSPQSEGRGHAS